MNLEYKKYSLDNLKTWIQDSLSSGDASPEEIFGTIKKAVEEEYYIYKNHTSRCYELLTLLNSNNIPDSIKEQVRAHGELWNKEDKITSCDKDDKSPECQRAWTSFWEENYYPEEVKLDDGMRPWGHSDLEYLIANPTLTEDRISNFPGEQYTEEELNAMCDKASSDEEKNKCREYNLREAEYYNKRAELDLTEQVSRNDSTRLEYKEGLIYESPDGGKTVYARKPGETERTLVKEEKTNKSIKVDGYSVDGVSHSKYWYEYDRNDPNRKNPFEDRVVKWQLPVQVDGLTGDCFVNLPDDLLELANLKEGDEVEWVEKKDGTYILRKAFKTIKMEEC